jgi:hypothetical protein
VTTPDEGLSYETEESSTLLSEKNEDRTNPMQEGHKHRIPDGFDELRESPSDEMPQNTNYFVETAIQTTSLLYAACNGGRRHSSELWTDEDINFRMKEEDDFILDDLACLEKNISLIKKPLFASAVSAARQRKIPAYSTQSLPRLIPYSVKKEFEDGISVDQDETIIDQDESDEGAKVTARGPLHVETQAEFLEYQKKKGENSSALLFQKHLIDRNSKSMYQEERPCHIEEVQDTSVHILKDNGLNSTVMYKEKHSVCIEDEKDLTVKMYQEKWISRDSKAISEIDIVRELSSYDPSQDSDDGGSSASTLDLIPRIQDYDLHKEKSKPIGVETSEKKETPVLSSVSTVLREILGVNVSPRASRGDQFTKALKSRHFKHRSIAKKEAMIEEVELTKSTSSRLFHVSRETRRSRLASAMANSLETRRTRLASAMGNYDQKQLKVQDSLNRNHLVMFLVPFLFRYFSMQQQNLLECCIDGHQLTVLPSESNEGLLLGVVHHSFSIMNTKSVKCQQNLPFNKTSPFQVDCDNKGLSSFMDSDDTVRNMSDDLHELVKDGLDESTIDKELLELVSNVYKVMETSSILENDAFDLNSLISDELSDDGLREKLETSDNYEDRLELLDLLEFENSEIKEFFETACVETDLSRYDYVDAHHSSIEYSDNDYDDDELKQELTNLSRVESQINNELSRIEIVERSKSLGIGTSPKYGAVQKLMKRFEPNQSRFGQCQVHGSVSGKDKGLPYVIKGEPITNVNKSKSLDYTKESLNRFEAKQQRETESMELSKKQNILVLEDVRNKEKVLSVIFPDDLVEPTIIPSAKDNVPEDEMLAERTCDLPLPAPPLETTSKSLFLPSYDDTEESDDIKSLESFDPEKIVRLKEDLKALKKAICEKNVQYNESIDNESNEDSSAFETVNFEATRDAVYSVFCKIQPTTHSEGHPSDELRDDESFFISVDDESETSMYSISRRSDYSYQKQGKDEYTASLLGIQPMAPARGKDNEFVLEGETVMSILSPSSEYDGTDDFFSSVESALVASIPSPFLGSASRLSTYREHLKELEKEESLLGIQPMLYPKTKVSDAEDLVISINDVEPVTSMLSPSTGSTVAHPYWEEDFDPFDETEATKEAARIAVIGMKALPATNQSLESFKDGRKQQEQDYCYDELPDLLSACTESGSELYNKVDNNNFPSLLNFGSDDSAKSPKFGQRLDDSLVIPHYEPLEDSLYVEPSESRKERLVGCFNEKEEITRRLSNRTWEQEEDPSFVTEPDKLALSDAIVSSSQQKSTGEKFEPTSIEVYRTSLKEEEEIGGGSAGTDKISKAWKEKGTSESFEKSRIQSAPTGDKYSSSLQSEKESGRLSRDIINTEEAKSLVIKDYVEGDQLGKPTLVSQKPNYNVKETTKERESNTKDERTVPISEVEILNVSIVISGLDANNKIESCQELSKIDSYPSEESFPVKKNVIDNDGDEMKENSNDSLGERISIDREDNNETDVFRNKFESKDLSEESSSVREKDNGKTDVFRYIFESEHPSEESLSVCEEESNKADVFRDIFEFEYSSEESSSVCNKDNKADVFRDIFESEYPSEESSSVCERTNTNFPLEYKNKVDVDKMQATQNEFQEKGNDPSNFRDEYSRSSSCPSDECNESLRIQTTQSSRSSTALQHSRSSGSFRWGLSNPATYSKHSKCSSFPSDEGKSKSYRWGMSHPATYSFCSALKPSISTRSDEEFEFPSSIPLPKIFSISVASFRTESKEIGLTSGIPSPKVCSPYLKDPTEMTKARNRFRWGLSNPATYSSNLSQSSSRPSDEGASLRWGLSNPATYSTNLVSSSRRSVTSSSKNPSDEEKSISTPTKAQPTFKDPSLRTFRSVSKQTDLIKSAFPCNEKKSYSRELILRQVQPTTKSSFQPTNTLCRQGSLFPSPALKQQRGLDKSRRPSLITSEFNERHRKFSDKNSFDKDKYARYQSVDKERVLDEKDRKLSPRPASKQRGLTKSQPFLITTESNVRQRKLSDKKSFDKDKHERYQSLDEERVFDETEVDIAFNFISPKGSLTGPYDEFVKASISEVESLSDKVKEVADRLFSKATKEEASTSNPQLLEDSEEQKYLGEYDDVMYWRSDISALTHQFSTTFDSKSIKGKPTLSAKHVDWAPVLIEGGPIKTKENRKDTTEALQDNQVESNMNVVKPSEMNQGSKDSENSFWCYSDQFDVFGEIIQDCFTSPPKKSFQKTALYV